MRVDALKVTETTAATDSGRPTRVTKVCNRRLIGDVDLFASNPDGLGGGRAPKDCRLLHIHNGDFHPAAVGYEDDATFTLRMGGSIEIGINGTVLRIVKGTANREDAPGRSPTYSRFLGRTLF
jgi:hypothetical protein